MKQTKTTLTLGVLLAIIIIVIVALEIKNQPPSINPNKAEESSVLPVAKKISLSVVPILKFASTIFIVDPEKINK